MKLVNRRVVLIDYKSDLNGKKLVGENITELMLLLSRKVNLPVILGDPELLDTFSRAIPCLTESVGNVVNFHYCKKRKQITGSIVMHAYFNTLINKIDIHDTTCVIPRVVLDHKKSTVLDVLALDIKL